LARLTPARPYMMAAGGIPVPQGRRRRRRACRWRLCPWCVVPLRTFCPLHVVSGGPCPSHAYHTRRAVVGPLPVPAAQCASSIKLYLWELCPVRPAPPPQHDCVYNRMVEGKPPCSPTDDRCCQCGVYVCSECTTGLYPGHSASQGAHCCKVSVASWVETLHVRCGTCAWVHLRVTVLPGSRCGCVVWLVSVDARSARVRLYALCEGVAMGAGAVFADALGFCGRARFASVVLWWRTRLTTA
jgi:hypothetical protein